MITVCSTANSHEGRRQPALHVLEKELEEKIREILVPRVTTSGGRLLKEPEARHLDKIRALLGKARYTHLSRREAIFTDTYQSVVAKLREVETRRERVVIGR